MPLKATQWARGPVFRTFAIGLEAWRCLEDVLMPSSGLCLYQIIYFTAPLVTSSTRHVHKTTRRPDLMTFAIGLEACRFLEDVLMPSSGLCHYQIKYFKAPLVTSSTRYVHKTTRRPLEDQSSWRFQVHLKHEDVLKTSWCLPQGYVTIKLNILKPNWWRLQHVMFIWPQEDHPKTSPHITFTSGLEAWICLEDVLTPWSLLCDYEIKYCKGPLVTSSTRHVHKTKKDHPKTSPHDVCKWTWSMNMSLSNKICKALLDTSLTRHIYARRPNW